jgi:DNA modification methylase
MTPYYQQDGCTIYCCDNRELLGEWSGFRAKSFDLLCTDPPYGLGYSRARNRGGSGALMQHTGFFAGEMRREAPDYGADDSWDDNLAAETVAQAVTITRWQIVFGGNYYDLGPTRCYLVWDKENGDTYFADCELAWTNFDRAVRRLVYRWNGMLQQPGRPKEPRIHPTQKPEAVMVWAIGLAPSEVQTVLDPFMGSGTTLVAAKRLNKQAIGIEQSEKYCEIAAKRLAQRALPLEL